MMIGRDLGRLGRLDHERGVAELAVGGRAGTTRGRRASGPTRRRAGAPARVRWSRSSAIARARTSVLTTTIGSLTPNESRPPGARPQLLEPGERVVVDRRQLALRDEEHQAGAVPVARARAPRSARAWSRTARPSGSERLADELGARRRRRPAVHARGTARPRPRAHRRRAARPAARHRMPCGREELCESARCAPAGRGWRCAARRPGTGARASSL